MVFIDTSALIGSLSGPRTAAAVLVQILEAGEQILIPSLVLYEWSRGPRTREELEVQERLFPSASAVPYGAEEAALSAGLYRTVKRARGREMDLAIAACAIHHGAALWTLNRADFADIPGLSLYASK